MEGEEMQQAISARAPAHLWIVGILSLLWNLFGAYDYTMTRTRGAEYIAGMMPGVDANATMAWINAMPMYAQVGWGLGVWFGLLGAVLLLMRSRWSVTSFALSLIGALLSLGYQLALAPPMPGETDSMVMKIMPYVIILLAAVQLWYAWRVRERGLLR
jgi:hypothetical protein